MRNWQPILLAMWMCACGGQLGKAAPAEGVDGSARDAQLVTDAAVEADVTSVDVASNDSMGGAPDTGQQVVNPCLGSGCLGCCQVDGTCVEESTSACGDPGQLCLPCPPGDSCHGVCEHNQTDCGPANCPGCCLGKLTCSVGNADHFCGSGGHGCENCAATGSTCVVEPDGGGGNCSGPATCSSLNCGGCCEASVCLVGQDDGHCGYGGSKCQPCGASTLCTPISMGGMCSPIPSCGAQNCSGCCANGICATGNQDVACGIDGGACADCTQSQKACTGSVCQ